MVGLAWLPVVCESNNNNNNNNNLYSIDKIHIEGYQSHKN